MKTKFILHGGVLRRKDEHNDAYFRELQKDLVDGDEILSIGFARRNEKERAEVYQRDRGLILAQTDKNIKVINATYDDLIDQIKRAKVIHIPGGESPELVKDMQKYPDFIGSLSGKVVGGSSAGACLFSAYYYYGEQQAVLEGLGTLPIRLMVHYGSAPYRATDESLDLLKTYSPDLELVVLEECEWTVKEIDI